MLDAEFQTALEAEGANPSLEDIPEKPRGRSSRRSSGISTRDSLGPPNGSPKSARPRLQFRAEEHFPQDEHGSLHRLHADGEAREALRRGQRHRQRDGRGPVNATVVEGHKAIVEKGAPRCGERDREGRRAAEAARAEDPSGTSRSAGPGRARQRRAPFAAGVEEGIAAHITIHGEISEAEIRTIAKNKAKVFKDATRENRRARSADFVKGKVEDRKKAPLKIRPGSGIAPAPAGRKVAKNDQEFIEEFAGRL